MIISEPTVSTLDVPNSFVSVSDKVVQINQECRETPEAVQPSDFVHFLGIGGEWRNRTGKEKTRQGLDGIQEDRHAGKLWMRFTSRTVFNSVLRSS